MNVLVVQYKFQKWDTHSTTGKPVTDRQKRARARQIAGKLCKHSRWLTHGRSIKMTDLRDELNLQVTDFSQNPDLCDAIRRYYTLLRMSFEGTSLYKVFETPTTQILRFMSPPAPAPAPAQAGKGEIAQVDFDCPRCSTKSRIQANLGKKHPLQEGSLPFPANNKFKCSNCGFDVDLGDLRKQLEAQSKKKIIA